MCDRFLTFLAKNLSMNRQKNMPRNGSSRSNNSNNHAEEQEEDEFSIPIEKAEFEFSHEEDHKGVTATIHDERKADVSTARASDQQQEEEAADQPVTAEAAAAAAVQEKKVRKSVSIKDDREEAGDKDAAGAKKSLFKRRQASSSGHLGAEGEDPKPPRRGLRPRMPAILRVPSNIDEQSATFIEERKKSFHRGKQEK